MNPPASVVGRAFPSRAACRTMPIMTRPLLPAWTDVSKPIIGMLHLPPLPGAPKFGGDAAAIQSRVLADAAALLEGGVDGLMIENFGDTPFYPDRVPAEVVAHMTHLAHEVQKRFDVPLGINVLRNDGCSALAIALAIGATLIRVNVLCGARLTDQGIVQGIAHELLRLRVRLDAHDVRILADVNVKHSSSLGPPRPIEAEVADLIERGGADALVVSGEGTGRPVDPAELAQVKAAAGDTPVLVGSGASPETIADLLTHADGAIVGTSLKQDGVTTKPVDPARVRALIAAAKGRRP
jgi:membrane complex biogenesis BtpA family protein